MSSRSPKRLRFLAFAAAATLAPTAMAADPEPPGHAFLDQYCFDCHDSETKKGNLDLTSLGFDLNEPKTFSTWVKVYDRLRDHEMPPKKKAQPEPKAAENFLKSVEAPLIAADQAREAEHGRAVWRRLNRYEYENSLRDLLHAPWLQIKEMLPEDGEAHRFNKSGDALDVSHVQMARYLAAADYALRQVLAPQEKPPEKKTVRYYARQQPSFISKLQFSVFNARPERAVFPILGTEAQPKVITKEEPVTAGAANPERREQEAFGVVASSYEPIEPKFNQFKAPVAGRYKLRVNAFTFWAGPSDGPKWWIPDRNKVSPGRRSEPVTLYSHLPPRQLRRVGAFDATPEPSVHELDVWLLEGESIQPDAARLFRSRPPAWHNPLATPEGMPGVAFRWLEVEGPICEQWPPAGQQLLFAELPVKAAAKGGGVEVLARDPAADAERLLRRFMERAYRRPVQEADVQRFLIPVQQALASGSGFADAMLAGYSAVLCSPGFVCLEEKPGPLDNDALAERLSYFVWNSAPDDTLRAAAARGELRNPNALRTQTERLMQDPRSERFVNAFLDYWLDLRKVNGNSPDASLYPDYYLDDLLVESATQETQAFFGELLRGNLPSRNIVSSDFAMLNERLATHYGLFAAAEDKPAEANAKQASCDEAKAEQKPQAPAEPKPLVEGVAIQQVALPADSPRGGILTQASVLKVTANGTTTSPVVRGAWVMERILGRRPPPPPPTVPAVEPDIRGASTIREQLAKHRTLETCSACHAKIDPAGFALENFDVMGGWRDHYRALGEGVKEKGFGKNGQPFDFHAAQPVDASGTLPDGRDFHDIQALKRLLLADERQIARNLAQQLVVFATGAPVSFGDRPEIERILDRAKPGGYGVRSIIHELVQSELFQKK